MSLRVWLSLSWNSGELFLFMFILHCTVKILLLCGKKDPKEVLFIFSYPADSFLKFCNGINPIFCASLLCTGNLQTVPLFQRVDQCEWTVTPLITWGHTHLYFYMAVLNMAHCRREAFPLHILFLCVCRWKLVVIFIRTSIILCRFLCPVTNWMNFGWFV